MKAVNDKIIIKKESTEEKTKGGLIIANQGAEHQSKGTVLSVGNGILLNDGTRSKLCVKKGDKVLFSGGTLIDHEGESYIVLSESNILATL